MSHSSRYFAAARFCPRCGCERLRRDIYRQEHGKTLKDGRQSFANAPAEFVCDICGFGFSLRPSLRVEHAHSIFEQERKKRPPNTPVDFPEPIAK